MSGVWLNESDCDLNAFRAVVEQRADPNDYPLADSVERNVLLYQSARLLDSADRRAIQAELARALSGGPGVVVFQGAFPDPAVVDRASDVFRTLIEEQGRGGAGRGDHFAKPGANDRVWNALEKLALRAPEVFADYYSNPMLALVSEAWLGPGYQVTSQVNVVNPGGEAQAAHRDYHLGFMTDEQAAAYPAQVHRLSPVLTLQGAVAHCDMPLAAGPTLYLPYSHLYEPGYLAWRLPAFRAYFDERCVQLPLVKGDAVFFNPAVFHAAGANRTQDVKRMANLLQVSSAMGRAMESVDRETMSNSVYPVLRKRKAEGASESWLHDVIAACSEGYPFPTNLDRDPPVDGLAPASQADLVRQALDEDWAADRLRDALAAAARRQRTR